MLLKRFVLLLFGKYRGIAWFSLGLAVFFDISSLLAGLFFMDFQRKRLRIRK